MDQVVAHIDGGSRGNPGPSAIGIVVEAKDIKLKTKKAAKEYAYGERIEDTTNNVAEYRALIFAFRKIKHLISKEKAKSANIEIISDSELLVKQMNNEYKIESSDLVPLFVEAHNLLLDFKNVSFTLVPREKNREADRLVNKALDTLI